MRSAQVIATPGFLSRVSIIDRYLAEQITKPLLATLLVSILLLMLSKMLNLFDFVIEMGGPVTIVWKMLSNMIPQYFSLGIPIGLLLGIVLTWRNLSLHSELDAIIASGVPYRRLMRIPLLYCLFLSIIVFIIVAWVQPLARKSYDRLSFDLRSGALGATIKVGSYAKLGKNTILRVDRARDGVGHLEGIFLQTLSKDGMELVANSNRGTFIATDNPNILILRLFEGNIVMRKVKLLEQPKNEDDISSLIDYGFLFRHDVEGIGKDVHSLRFESQDIPITLPRTEPEANSLQRQQYAKTITELWNDSQSSQLSAEQQRAAIAQIHRRTFNVFVMFCLPFMGLGLGVLSKRQNSALGIFLSIFILILFIQTSAFIEEWSIMGQVPLHPSQWILLAVLVMLSAVLYLPLVTKVGVSPVTAIHDAFAYLVRISTGPVRKAVDLIRTRRSAGARNDP